VVPASAGQSGCFGRRLDRGRLHRLGRGPGIEWAAALPVHGPPCPKAAAMGQISAQPYAAVFISFFIFFKFYKLFQNFKILKNL
jgi:hypothetical protein